jgi:hypothetical protein
MGTHLSKVPECTSLTTDSGRGLPAILRIIGEMARGHKYTGVRSPTHSAIFSKHPKPSTLSSSQQNHVRLLLSRVLLPLWPRVRRKRPGITSTTGSAHCARCRAARRCVDPGSLDDQAERFPGSARWLRRYDGPSHRKTATVCARCAC